MKKKIKDYLYVIIISISFFIVAGAFWIRKTYGLLTVAMANVSFVNFLDNKRSLFLKYVILPTLGIFIILVILQTIFREKKIFTHKKALFLISVVLLIFSCCVAERGLGMGAFFVRQHRLGKEQWYDIDRLIVHALGEIDGITYTNSKEAMENSYNNGRRLLECDLIMTSDNQVVACHEWEEVPTYTEFISTKIMGKYTAIGGLDLILFMKDHPDVYVITDTKEADPEILGEPFEALVDLAYENDCEEVLERFIVQIYHGYMYEMINNIYPFENYVFTLYQEGFRGSKEKMEEYASFCACHNVDVITLNAQYYNDDLLDICNRYNLQVFVHTVNDEKEIKAFLEKGVGVYTDITTLSAW